MSVKRSRPVAPPRRFIGVKLSENGVAWLDQIATDVDPTAERSINRSTVIRAALKIARMHEREVRALLSGQI